MVCEASESDALEDNGICRSRQAFRKKTFWHSLRFLMRSCWCLHRFKFSDAGATSQQPLFQIIFVSCSCSSGSCFTVILRLAVLVLSFPVSLLLPLLLITLFAGEAAVVSVVSLTMCALGAVALG